MLADQSLPKSPRNPHTGEQLLPRDVSSGLFIMVVVVGFDGTYLGSLESMSVGYGNVERASTFYFRRYLVPVLTDRCDTADKDRYSVLGMIDRDFERGSYPCK